MDNCAYCRCTTTVVGLVKYHTLQNTEIGVYGEGMKWYLLSGQEQISVEERCGNEQCIPVAISPRCV